MHILWDLLHACVSTWGVLCQKEVSRARTSNYIPQYLWDVITCCCPWYLLLLEHSSYMIKTKIWVTALICTDVFVYQLCVNELSCHDHKKSYAYDLYNTCKHPTYHIGISSYHHNHGDNFTDDFWLQFKFLGKSFQLNFISWLLYLWEPL